MPRSYLLVHPASYRRVTAVTDYILDQLQRHAPEEVELRLCSDIDRCDVAADCVVFVIGDPFGPFRRRPGCRYVFLNFSLLYPLGGEMHYSSMGRRWVDDKHRKFAEKVRRFDCVLDYYPEQTERLGREFGIPALTFPIALKGDAYSRPDEPSFDVCFVGAPTPRRVVLARRLVRMGYRLSPATGVVLEDTAARSKIVLNAHALRSANIEFPRVVSALLSGSALVTENAAGMPQHFPPHLYVGASYRGLAEAVAALLADPAETTRLATAAAAWMRSTYLPQAAATWARLVPAVYSSLCRPCRA